MTNSSIAFGYVTGIELINIRGFKRLAIEPNGADGPRMLSVIIGRNGPERGGIRHGEDVWAK